MVERLVVSLKGSHEIQSINALHSILWNAVLNILESTSLNEHVFLLVDSCVLVVNLDLMEGAITKTTSVNDKSTLGNASNILIHIIFFVVITLIAV